MQKRYPEDIAADHEVCAADGGSSRALKREMVERLYAEPFWPVKQVIPWIAFRDPAHLADTLRQAIFYGTRHPAPAVTLAQALQDGSLPAFRGGAEIRREWWAGIIRRDWPDDVFVRREDALDLWPTSLGNPDRAVRIFSKHKKTSAPARTRAERALREVFPGGVPDQASEPNSTMCQKVGKWLENKGLRDVSDDSILRAAGRRK
jgi:hypothetical protein